MIKMIVTYSSLDNQPENWGWRVYYYILKIKKIEARQKKMTSFLFYCFTNIFLYVIKFFVKSYNTLWIGKFLKFLVMQKIDYVNLIHRL